MKAIKYSFSETNKIDLGTKIIYKYPTPTETHDIALMKINGRNPVDETMFNLEHANQFVMYVTKGEGKVTVEKDVFELKVGDVVFVPKENKFAVEGEMEYVTVVLPAFIPGQSEEVKG